MKKQDMETIILGNAEKLFLAKGFNLTSTTQIAEASGCNQALVHYYFRTKAKLFDGIFNSKLKLFMSSFLHISEETLPFQKKLEKMILAHFDILTANPKLPFFIINELTKNPQRLDHFKESLQGSPQQILHKLEEELKIEVRSGRLRPTTAIELMLTLASLNVSLFLLSPMLKVLTNYSDEDYALLIAKRRPEHVRIILQSLLPDEASQ